MKIKSGESYAQFVLRLRKAAKLTQEELALSIGTTLVTVSRWERGVTAVSFRMQNAIDRFARKIK